MSVAPTIIVTNTSIKVINNGETISMKCSITERTHRLNALFEEYPLANVVWDR